ncbi:MAG: AbrB/MazE/SpoVT family DNA-binding domain-containing protein, partial [Nitrosopumilaceae archaeon]
MDVEVVRMSSKGQFVMPLSMRRRLKMRKGEKLMLVENKGTIVVRPVKELENLNEELYLMRLA